MQKEMGDLSNRYRSGPSQTGPPRPSRKYFYCFEPDHLFLFCPAKTEDKRKGLILVDKFTVRFANGSSLVRRLKSFMSSPCSILTPLQDSWQQFSPPEICNHTCDSRSRHSTRAEAKVVPPPLLSTLFHSGVTPLQSGSLRSRSTRP